jgi:hypothetical protein
MHDKDMVELEEKKERERYEVIVVRGIYLHHAYFYTLGHGILQHNNVYIAR